MPLQNLKSLYAESSDLPSFTRAVSPCPPTAATAKPPLPGLLPLLRIALRADKTDQSFKAMIYLAAAVINSR